jgi:hypothetical protein
MSNPARSVLNRKSEIVNRKLDKPAYNAPISPGPPTLPILPTRHHIPKNPASRIEHRPSPHQSCPESQNVRRITYEFISFLCKTNPISKNTQNHRNSSYQKGLQQYSRLRITKNKAKTNPNEPKRTQSNPNFSPKNGPQSQNEPKRTQSCPPPADSKAKECSCL